MSNEETERRTALSEICQKMKEGIFIGDQKFLGMTFKNVFKGTDAITWLRENVTGIRSDGAAKKLGNELIKARLITHCSSDKLPFTKACFYRFVESNDPKTSQAGSEQPAALPVAIIWGGSGNLGSVIVQRFKESKWTVVTVDRKKNELSDHSIVMQGDGSKEDSQLIIRELKKLNADVEVIICVAGGFSMEKISDPEVFDGLDKMITYNVKSAISASYVAAHCLTEGGLLVLTGAAAATSGTPTMIPYGCTKAAVHSLVKHLTAEGSGMPQGATVVGLLPVMLDTASNRQTMPDADFTTWTPPAYVAELMIEWASADRPQNGALVALKTSKKITQPVVVG